MKKLSKEEMKKVVGGVVDWDHGDGTGSGSSKSQKCCPKGNCSSPSCSACVEIPQGSHADCSDNPNAQVCNC